MMFWYGKPYQHWYAIVGEDELTRSFLEETFPICRDWRRIFSSHPTGPRVAA